MKQSAWICFTACVVVTSDTMSPTHTALQVFKIVNRISPPYLHGVFSFAVDVTGRSSRNIHGLYVPSVRTNFGKLSLAYRGTAIWNRLPPALYSAKTVSEFKKLYCML